MKSPVTSLRSSNVIQKTTGHSSKPRSAEINTFDQRTVNKTGGSRTPIKTVTPGSRAMLTVNKIPVKTKYTSARLPSVRTESKYVKVIEKKSSSRNAHERIVSSDLKSGKLSKDLNASSRISNLSRKPLSKINHENVRESVDRVVLEKKSITIKDSKKVNIEGNNNIYVEGNYYEAKDYKPAKNYKDYRVYSNINHSTGHIHYLSSHKWCNCGKFHLLRWSNSSCARVVYFNHGLSLGISYIYPKYHRKYLFVSIGGSWPHEYRYRRYYEYGCHPNTWYGSQPYEYPSVDNSVTNNYYYSANTQPAVQGYNDNSAGTYGGVYPSSYAGSYETIIDKSTESSYNGYEDFSDVRDRLAAEQDRQVEEAVEDAPAEESLADIYFENAVEAFAGGDYQSAIDAVNKAIALAPVDEVLPFTLVQSLFAGGYDTEAAVLLRGLFESMPRDREAIYYPRGLYPDDDVLQRQIQSLSNKVENEPADGDLNLLLAYHLLGTGEFEKAAEPLYKAKLHVENDVSVAIMEDLLQEARTNEQIDIESSL